MDNINNDNQGQTEPPVISPDQSSIFDITTDVSTAGSEEPTRMEIPHVEAEPTYTLGAAAQADDSQSMAHSSNGEDVSNSTKIKVLASLAIVAVAGYVAYWVQEPVQLKADLFGGSSSSESPADAMKTSTPVTPASSSEVAANPVDGVSPVTLESKNVDVSLFGFEPAVMKIDKGTTVIWTNTSTEDQTLIGSSDDGQSFASPVLTSGSTFSFKFEQDAAFTYYSTYNPALKATITVGAGSVVVAPVAAETDLVAAATTDSSGSSSLSSSLFGSASSSTDSTPVNDASLSSEFSDSSFLPEATLTSAMSEEELKNAAPTGLTKTGPAENIYAVVLLGIAWFNRKKLAGILK